jgi:hypothetical protein
VSGISPTEPASPHREPPGRVRAERAGKHRARHRHAESPAALASTLRRRRHQGLARQIAPAIVIAGLLGSFLIMIPESFGYRAACAGIAATCLAAAMIRSIFPTSWVGVLAIRGRVLDVAMYAVAAAGVVTLAFSVPLPGGS